MTSAGTPSDDPPVAPPDGPALGMQGMRPPSSAHDVLRLDQGRATMSPSANSLSDADWFWRKVDRSGECWMWTGATNGAGYGRVCLGQEYIPAHKIAWHLVMGTWPADRLYRTGPCRDGIQGHKKGDLKWRLCVRPHHYRDGQEPNAKTRWNPRAQSGFPPEFRTASQTFMSTDEADKTLQPLLLYRGSLNMGRAQAMFNFTMVAQAAEAERLGDVVQASRAWPDVAHAVGFHKPLSVVSTVTQFWGRVLDNPLVTVGRPGMRDYIETTLAASGVRPIKLDRISSYSRWSTRSWRKLRPAPYAPPPTVWPFMETVATASQIQEAPNPEHDLVMKVDRAVPKGLPENVRQDVCQDMILAVLEGEVAVENLAAEAGPFIKRVFTQFPMKYGPLSLDAPAPWSHGDDDRTLGDLIMAAGWDPEQNRWEEGAA